MQALLLDYKDGVMPHFHERPIAADQRKPRQPLPNATNVQPQQGNANFALLAQIKVG